MKKIFGVLMGMVMIGVLIGVPSIVKAQTVQEARAECTARGGTLNVYQVYSDGSASTSCSVSGGTQVDTDTTRSWTNTDDANKNCPYGYEIVGGSSQGASYKCKPYTDNVYNELNGNTEQSPFNGGYGSDTKDTSGSGYGTSSSSGSGGNGASNSSGTGMIGNDDNSDARKKDECGDGQVNTFLFGDCAGGTDGEGVFMVLNVILQVFTWGVGIAGTLGIVLVGIQYMTSKDDPAQMTKAKSRMIQIVIGLVAYALLWAFLQWLLPGGVLGE